jgi:hypothetical protein
LKSYVLRCSDAKATPEERCCCCCCVVFSFLLSSLIYLFQAAVRLLNGIYDGHDWQRFEAFEPVVRNVGDSFVVEIDTAVNQRKKIFCFFSCVCETDRFWVLFQLSLCCCRYYNYLLLFLLYYCYYYYLLFIIRCVLLHKPAPAAAFFIRSSRASCLLQTTKVHFVSFVLFVLCFVLLKSLFACARVRSSSCGLAAALQSLRLCGLEIRFARRLGPCRPPRKVKKTSLCFVFEIVV